MYQIPEIGGKWILYHDKKTKKIKSAIARVIFFSLFISEDYILAHDCTLQETQNQNSKKRTGLTGLRALSAT